MKKFVITGIPRSGTTAVVRHLQTIDYINLYHGGNFYGEPFSGSRDINFFEINPYARLEKTENECKNPYFGFKLFFSDQIRLDYLLNNGYKAFAVIRKDLWKAVLSHFCSRVNITNDGVDSFNGSSLRFPRIEKFESIEDMKPETVTALVRGMTSWIKATYALEKIYNAEIIYFEDLIKPNATFDNLNNFFNKEIIFNLDYKDDHDIYDYFPNYNPVIFKEISAILNEKITLPANTPDYIKSSLYKYL